MLKAFFCVLVSFVIALVIDQKSNPGAHTQHDPALSQPVEKSRSLQNKSHIRLHDHAASILKAREGVGSDLDPTHLFFATTEEFLAYQDRIEAEENEEYERFVRNFSQRQEIRLKQREENIKRLADQYAIPGIVGLFEKLNGKGADSLIYHKFRPDSNIRRAENARKLLSEELPNAAYEEVLESPTDFLIANIDNGFIENEKRYAEALSLNSKLLNEFIELESYKLNGGQLDQDKQLRYQKLRKTLDVIRNESTMTSNQRRERSELLIWKNAADEELVQSGHITVEELELMRGPEVLNFEMPDKR